MLYAVWTINPANIPVLKIMLSFEGDKVNLKEKAGHKRLAYENAYKPHLFSYDRPSPTRTRFGPRVSSAQMVILGSAQG